MQTIAYYRIAKEDMDSTGYEAGLMGMNGREWYGGVRAFGFHTEYAQDGGLNFGGSFQAYLAYGNNTGKKGADGKMGSLVSTELWLPTLGDFGHFAFGETYDVSDQGLNNVQEKLIANLYENSGKVIPDYYTEEGFKIFVRDMGEFGYDVVITPEGSIGNGNHHGDKVRFKKTGTNIFGNYGNIEIIKASKAYGGYHSSYNYGNNLVTHFLIDYRGYKGRGY